MPRLSEYESFDGVRLHILPDYAERNFNAAVRDRFREECVSRGYEVRESLRYKRGLQAWRGDQLVGEFVPNGSEAWVLK